MPVILNADSGAISGISGLTTSADNSGVLQFQSSGTATLTITTAGNVGIGTASPGYKLQVTNSTGIDTELATTNSAGVSRYGTRGSGNAFIGAFSSGKALEFWSAGSNTMTLDSSGNLGLGVSPSAWAVGYKSIDFGGNAAISGFSNSLYLTANAYDAGGNYLYKASTNASLYLQTAGTHRWYNAPSGTAGNAISFTQAMTLDSSGNLLVGTTSADGRLTVSGSAGLMGSFNSTNVNGGYLSLLSSGAYYADIGTAAQCVGGSASDFAINARGARNLVLGTNNTERMRIDSSGNVFFKGNYVSFNDNGYIRCDKTNSLALQTGTSSTVGFQIRTSGDSNTMLSMNGSGGHSLALEGATPKSGIGITFPASQAASSDPNTLDDYEEGTWTGTWQGNSIAGTMSGSILGQYTKVGRQVTCTFQVINTTLSGASGRLQITGLPFASIGTNGGGTMLFEGFTPAWTSTVNASNHPQLYATDTTIIIRAGMSTPWDNFLLATSTFTGGGGSTYGSGIITYFAT